MKLDGIKVVDLSLFLPGPQMTAMMADHGADVVKVEPKSGDPARQMGPFEAGQSLWFRNVNRGKSSIALNLKDQADRDQLYDLVRGADIFVEAFRPGVAKRLGIDYETLNALNPRLIYCSISAFGQTGALADHPAHDMAVQAFAGFMSINDARDRTPVVPAVPAADMAASLTALSGVLMAIIGRQKTGLGDYLDIAMFDSLVPWSSHLVGPALVDREPVQSAMGRSIGGAAFYQVYGTSDNRHLVLAGREEKFVRAVLNGLERPDLIIICLGEAGETQEPAMRVLSDIFRTKTLDQWVQWFETVEACFAPVLNFVEAFESAQMQDRDMLIFGPDKQHVIGTAIKFARDPGHVHIDAPALGSAF